MSRTTLGSADVNLHSVIATMLRAQVDDGELRPGERLPSEEALRKQFKVSRSTVRQALDTLEREGLIDRHVGRGTYVRHRGAQAVRQSRHAHDWQGAIVMAAEATRLVRRGIARPSPQFEAVFSDAGEAPFSIMVKHGRSAFAVKRHLRPGLPSIDDLANRTLESADFGQALAAALDTPVQIDRFWVEPLLAEPRFAMLLKVPTGSALQSLWWTHNVGENVIACVQMIQSGGGFSLDIVGRTADAGI